MSQPDLIAAAAAEYKAAMAEWRALRAADGPNPRDGVGWEEELAKYHERIEQALRRADAASIHHKALLRGEK